jgi:hypothetical protein
MAYEAVYFGGEVARLLMRPDTRNTRRHGCQVPRWPDIHAWIWVRLGHSFNAFTHSASSVMSPSSELLIDVLTPDHLAVLGGYRLRSAYRV